MKLLWGGEWRDVPRYTAPPGGLLVRVEAVCPLVPLGHASGRVIRSPYRRAWRFLRNEGVRSTYRKARTKSTEGRFSGDYHVAVLLGAPADAPTRLLALACRVPHAAEFVLVHPDLALEVDESYSQRDLERVADALAADADTLARHGRQSYLYSTQAPPRELVHALRRGADAARGGGSAPSSRAIVLPAGRRTPANAVWLRTAPTGDGRPAVVLLGAGDYARTEIVPAVRPRRFVRLAVADREPQIAALVAERAGFALATTDPLAAIDALPEPGIVVIATYHDSHAALAAAALDAGHRVLVEKPAVVTEDDLATLVEAAKRRPGALEVGFNRRFSGHVRRARGLLDREAGPATITCVVKEVELEPDHWYFWPNQGTRVTGNLCHWLDVGTFLVGGRAVPVEVTLSARVPLSAEFDHERAFCVTFDDGSLLTVVATGRGDEIHGVQELIEARRGSVTITIEDLTRTTVLRRGRRRTYTSLVRDRGHRAMYAESLGRLGRAEPARYALADVVLTSVVQIAASRLLLEDGVRVSVEADARRWRDVAAESEPMR